MNGGKVVRQMATGGNKKTEESLLGAALMLFGNKGYNGTTTRSIAVAAGVAEGNLFRYFPHKHDILMRLAWDFADMLKNHLKEDEAQDDASEESSVISRLESLIVEGVLNPRSALFPYFNVILTEAQYDPALQQFIENELFNGIVYRGKRISDIIQQLETQYTGIQMNHPAEHIFEILRLLALCQLAFFRRDTGADRGSSQRQNEHWEV